MVRLQPSERLGDAAAQCLAGVLGAAPSAESRRDRLDRAIDLAERAVLAAAQEAVSGGQGASRALARARLTLARAHAARAEDARHGAGQLSLSAQRAPTLDACESGWRRAATIVLDAEASAVRAAATAAELERDAAGTAHARAARAAAERASSAARAARTLLDTRNPAFTFHADEGFSFGEGWHVAAAAVLAGVAVQIEPGQPATPHAERFLRDAGVGAQLQPYRPRPRAMKQTTEIVARAFLADPPSAQRALRLAFLGADPIPQPVRAYADRRLAGRRGAGRRKVALWVRDGVHQPGRNTAADELSALTRRAERAGLVPVLIGEPVPEGCDVAGAVDLTLHRKDPAFRAADARRAQLQLFEHLRQAHGLVGQLGVTTAGMDGPALIGLPTAYLTQQPNPRLARWVGVVPGYEEVVRDDAYLERVFRLLRRWACQPLE